MEKCNKYNVFANEKIDVKNIWSRIWIYFIAFIVPVLVFIVACVGIKIYPFGSNSIVIGDGALQYVELFKELKNQIINEHSLFYSWNSGLGYNFWATYGYYLSSPLSLFAVFVESSYMELFVTLLIIVKIGFIGVTSTYYFNHSKINTFIKYKKLISLMLGMTFTLSNAIFAYYFNIMWLDGYICFPMILLGIEKIIDTKDWKLYYIWLTLSLFCSYYITIISILFGVLWAIDYEKGSIKKAFKDCGRCMVTTVASVCSAAIILVPSYLAVGLRYKSGKNSIGDMLLSLGDLWRLIQGGFSLSGFNKGDDIYTYNIYCGIVFPVLAALILFLPKFMRKLKIKRIVLIAFMLGSLCSTFLMYIWHGLSLPNGLNNRFTYVYVFLIVATCCQVLPYINHIKLRNYIVVFLSFRKM